MTQRFLAALALAAFFALPPPASAEPLGVLLDWFVNPDHGPLFVAQERGYFADAGLEVTFTAPADPNDPPKLVAAGKTELAVSYQPQLHLQADHDLPLVRIATLVSTPLSSLVVLKKSGITSVAQLKGKTIGFSVGGFEDAVLGAMLAKHGLSHRDVRLVNVNFALSASLISGKVDGVIGAYRNFELNQLDIEKQPGRAFYVEEEGVPPYDELIVITNRKLLGDSRLPRFVRALERGVQYLVNHPDESWRLFLKGHKELDDELNRRAWRDTVPRFALRPAALDNGRYRRFGEFLKARGLVERTPPVETYAVELH